MTDTITREHLLAELETGGIPRPKAPKTLPLAQLHTAPEVFQKRHVLLSLTKFEAKVRELLQRVRQGVTLDPITIWWSGVRWVVLDGHHRHEAYRRDARQRGTPEGAYKVPVAVFTGTLGEADAESIRDNSKVRNQASKQEVTEWTWQLLLTGEVTSPTAIEKVTGVSRKTVHLMRNRRDELAAQGVTTEAMQEQGWWRCRGTGQGRGMLDPEDAAAFKARMDETADRLFKALDKEFGGKWHGQADFIAYALATRAPKFAKMLVDSEHLWPLVQEVQRVDREAEAEEAAEMADFRRRNPVTISPDDPF